MPTNRRILSQDATVAAGDADAAQGLVLHLDANDEDSIESGGANTGAGSGTWFDIANHDLNVPLIDKASNLQLHLNASDTTSYGGSGTDWNDISGNSRNGVITDPVFESGLEGGLDFNSASSTSGDKVEVAHNAAFNVQNNMSFEVWVKRDSTSEGNIFFKGATNAGGGNSYFFSFNPSWGYYFYSYAFAGGGLAGGGTYTGTAGLATGVYEHVVVTIDGSGNRKIYVNGTMSANNNVHNATGTGSLTDTGALTIGGYYTYAVHTGFDGRISVVRIYNTVLTASEVAQNYRAGNTFSYSSIYDTNLAIHLDAADDTTLSATTWSDKANSNNATIGSSVGFSGTLSDYYDKELGNWLVLDGSDDNMTISSNSSFQNATAFSLEMWIQPISIAADEMLSTLYTSGSDFKWDLRFDTGGVLRWIVGTSSGASHSNQDLTTTDTLSTNTWYHIVATYDDSADTMKIYIDGLQSASESTPNQGTRTGGSDDIDIGHRIGSYEANIKIGQYRLYNTSLTAAQVAQNYLATKNDYPNGFNATISGADFDTNSSSPNENYFDFSGATSDLITIPDNDLFDMEANSSMEIWLTKSSGTAHIINKKGGGTESWSLWTNGTLIYFYAYNSGGSGATTALVTSSTLNATWNHIIVTVDDDLDYEIYLNGSSEATDTSLSNRLINSDTVKIGSYSGSNAYAGKVAMLKFHAKELSSSEVTANYNATKATFGIS